MTDKPKRKRTAYERGVAIERKLVNEFRSSGYLSSRSAGSKSIVDVYCITPSEVKLIQCKRVAKLISTTSFSVLYKDDIKELESLEVPDNVSKYLYVWLDRKGWIVFKIDNGLKLINKYKP